MKELKKKIVKRTALFVRTFRLLVRSKQHFFLYQLLYAMVTMLCVGPLTAKLGELAREHSGYSYITLENLPYFLLKPLTILVAVFLILIYAFFILWEISLIASFLLVGKNLDKRAGIYIFLGSLWKATYAFRKGNWSSLLLSFAGLIAANIIVVVGIVTQTRIPNYIVTSIAHLPIVKMVLAGIVGFIVLIVFQNLFTLFYFLLERKNMKQSVLDSKKLLKGHKLHSALCILITNVIVIVVSVAIYYLLITAEALFVMLFVNKGTAVAVFLSLREHVNVYAGIFLTWFGLYCNMGITLELFLRYKKVNEEIIYRETAHQHRLISDKKKRWIAIGLMILVFVADAAYTKHQVLNGNGISILPAFDGVKISAHRGFSSKAPENTLPAFAEAIDAMADFVELDVQQTKDGELIILHDSNLKRTTGVNKFIWNLTFDEVRSMDAGVWFSEEYAGTQIPTLEEAIQLCKGKALMNIEIKTNSHFKDLEEKVIELIQQYDLQNQCVVQSTDIRALTKVKELDPSIRTGIILMGAYGDFEASSVIDFFSIRSQFVNRNMVKSAHTNGKAVYAWTVNTKNEIRRMKVLKVDNIITDRPILARELLYQDNFRLSFRSLFKLMH